MPQLRHVLAFVLSTWSAVAAQHREDHTEYTVQLRVVDHLSSKPIQGAGLLPGDGALTTARALQHPTARTGADGTMSVRLRLGRGREGLLAAPGHATVRFTWRTDYYAKRPAPRVLDIGTIRMRRGVTVRGLARAADGKPIAGARVVGTDVFKWDRLSLPTMHECASMATTDAKGRFTLAGCPEPGVKIVIKKSGFRTFEQPLANRYGPVVAKLEPCGVTRGVVRGVDGKPAPFAEVLTVFEHHDQFVATHTGPDGTFAVPLEYRGRYRIGVTTPTGIDWSELFTEPKSKLELHGPTRAVVVRATDAKGQPIRTFRAAVVRLDAGTRSRRPDMFEWLFTHLAQPADATGAAQVRPTKHGRAANDTLIVRAPGYVPHIERFDHPAATRPPIKTVRLVQAPDFHGVVHDRKTGKPMRGVRVSLGDHRQDPARPPMASLWTDAKGRFRLRGLRAGDEALLFRSPWHLPARFAVKQPQPNPRVFNLPRGATLAGQLVGADLRPGLRVELQESPAPIAIFPTSNHYFPTDPPRRVTVHKDGKFQFRNVPPGRYRLMLLVPFALGVAELPLGTTQITSTDVERKLELGPTLKRAIHGKVKTRGAPLPPGRLLVVAQHIAPEIPNQFRMQRMVPGKELAALVGQDGTFRLPARQGPHRLRVLDLASGVTLRDAVITVPKEIPARIDWLVELAVVQLALTGSDTARRAVSRIDIAVTHRQLKMVAPGTPGRLPFPLASPDQGKRIGVTWRGQSLVVPALPLKLRAMCAFPYTSEPLGELPLQPKSATVTRGSLEVTPPRLEPK